MRDKVFSKKEFIKAVTENVKTMYRKTLKEASQQEIFQAVSLAVKDIIMNGWQRSRLSSMMIQRPCTICPWSF